MENVNFTANDARKLKEESIFNLLNKVICKIKEDAANGESTSSFLLPNYFDCFEGRIDNQIDSKLKTLMSELMKNVFIVTVERNNFGSYFLETSWY